MSEKNYITPLGLSRLRAEYQELRYKERPQVVETVAWAAGNGDRSENGDYIYGKKRLREIDRRLGFLSRHLDSAELVDPQTITSDRVRFGATVTILDEQDNQTIYAIVGTEESAPEQGRISWKSPIAKSLLGSRVGDMVVCKSPQGERELEIIDICYCEIS